MSGWTGGLRAVREALLSDRPPEKVVVRGAGGKRHEELVRFARRAGVPCVVMAERDIDALCGGSSQGAAALLAEFRLGDVEGLPTLATTLVVAIDGVTDPMNLGAILRSADAAGAAAIVLPKRRTAPLSPVAVKASAGALAHLTIVKVSSLADALLRLHGRGFMVAGLDLGGEDLHDAAPTLSGPLVMVLGQEGAGLHRLVRERCDRLITIRMHGHVESLNVSVAAGVAMFELRRAWRAGRDRTG